MERDTRLKKVIMAMLAMQRRSWEQGTAAQALLEAGETELLVLLAKDALVNRSKDGRLGLNGDSMPVADPASNGEPLMHAARVTGDTALEAGWRGMLDYLLYQAPRTRDGIIYHNHIENRHWVDALYMLPPFLAAAGCHQEALKQIRGYRSRLWDGDFKLFHHIWDEDTKSFSRKLFWGVGNGWAAAGMARVIRALPEAMGEEKRELAGYVGEVLDGCLRHQREDFLFHDILDDPASFIETNLAQMLCYSIYRGISGGWLDRRYLKYADEMRQTVYSKVDGYGLVQGVCGAPNFDRPGTAAEGQAFFILMEAAYQDCSA